MDILLTIKGNFTDIVSSLSRDDLWKVLNIMVLAYALHKWQPQKVSFLAACAVLFAWMNWDAKIGITIVSIYAVHYTFEYYKEQYETRSKGRIVGGGGFDGDAIGDSFGGAITNGGGASTGNANAVQETNVSDATDAMINKGDNDGGDDGGRLDHAHAIISEEVEGGDHGKTRSSNDKNRRKLRVGAKRNMQRGTGGSTTETTAVQTPPPLTSSKSHPGLNEFWIWATSISEIYRVYTIGPKYGEENAAVPTLNRSERGNIPVELHVSNQLIDVDINVYWVNFKGKEVFKGSIRRLYGNGNSLNITTWVGHPWVFRNKVNGKLLLHFVPYRVMPFTLAASKQASDNDNSYNYGDDDVDDDFVGRYEFTIAEANPLTSGYNEVCSVIDKTIPHPLSHINTINEAVKFSCEQMEREDVTPRILLKYLHNVLVHPTEPKYRQIRTSNKVFFNNVWINGGRGILHALGFEEKGAFVEMGPNVGSLPGERLKHLADAIVMLEELVKDMEDGRRNEIVKKPLGADGYSGRAGWGIEL